MEFWLALLGIAVATAGNVPYVLETIAGKTKPRVVTWATWALLTCLAAAAAFTDGQVVAGLFALLGTIATGATAIAGWHYGDKSFNKLDIACAVGVVVGLGLWLLFNSPAIGVWAAIIIDCVGLVPTYKHAWVRPHEETLQTYVLIFVGGLITSGSIIYSGQLSVTALGYPLYTAVSLGLVAVIIMIRRSTEVHSANKREVL